MKIEIELGMVAERGSAPVPGMVDVEELLATRLLVQGNSGSGKSHLLRRLLEQSATHVQQVIIDPEGDFVSLAEVYGHVVIEANRSEAELVTIANRVRQHRVSAVLDLSSLEVDMQMRAAAYFLNALFEAERAFWYPILVVVDEAQLFAPAATGDVAEDARRLSLAAMTNLMCRGRKRGLAGVIATQRLAKLAKNVAAEASNFLMGRTFLDIDMTRAADLLGVDRNKTEMFRELPRGSFVALGPALCRRPMAIQVGPVVTEALGSAPALTPPPAPNGAEAVDILAPVTITSGRATVAMPKPLQPPPIAEVLAEVERERPDPDMGTGPIVPEEDRSQAYRAILADIMSEPAAAFTPEAELFHNFQVHCRIKRLGKPLTLEEFKPLLIEARAGVDPGSAGDEGWRHASAVADGLPEDVKAAYLLLARAAMEGLACPSDADIARACGSRSPSRGRARIAFLERDTFITVRKDMKGNRVIALPDLGWETAPGDPKALDTLAPA
jgi:uncharacterized protein